LDGNGSVITPAKGLENQLFNNIWVEVRKTEIGNFLYNAVDKGFYKDEHGNTIKAFKNVPVSQSVDKLPGNKLSSFQPKSEIDWG